MKPRTQAGWYADPDRRHDARYWDGARWTAHVGDSDATSEDPLRSRTAGTPGRAEREQRGAWWCFGGVIAAIILNGIWTLFVGTASMGGDDSELVGGWAGVFRNLPGYLLVVGVAALGVRFAARSVRHGARAGHSALTATSLMLLFALNSVTRDAAEVVMTTRAATVAWLLFGADVCVVIMVYLGVRRWSGASRPRPTADQQDAGRPAPNPNSPHSSSGR